MRKATKKADEPEPEAVNRTLDLCERLNLDPEDLGLQKRPDGSYHLTYLTCKIMEKTAEVLGRRKGQTRPIGDVK